MTLEQKEVNGVNVITFPTFCWRIIATYMGAYLIAGIIAQVYYRPIWDSGALSAIMRPVDSPWVALGPALQSVNAFFTAIVLFPVRRLIIYPKNGWATLFLLVAGFSIFVPQAPAPSSFEGLIYTKLTLFEHLIGLPETMTFSLLFSIGFFRWYKGPNNLWNMAAIALIALIVLLSVLGFLAAIGILPRGL